MVTRTLVVPLETSNRKLEKMRTVIDEYNELVNIVHEILPSYKSHQWKKEKTTIEHKLLEQSPHKDRVTGSAVARGALHKALAAFQSWRERGFPGDYPGRNELTGTYFQIPGKYIRIETNDRGWGVECRAVPHNSEWFHIDSAPYHEEYLERITDPDDELDFGESEFHLHGDDFYLHLTYSEDIDTRNYADSETILGVDLNIDPLIVTAGIDTETGEYKSDSVTFESGAELRHHRNRLQKRKAIAQKTGNAARVSSPTQLYHNFTKHVTEVASRRVIEQAIEHRPAAIHLEDLKGIREDRNLHEWPFAMIQSRIEEKAAEEGIPVKKIDPAYTSKTCRKCGTVHGSLTSETMFECPNCGYEVHRDVNAAFNIATSEPIDT